MNICYTKEHDEIVHEGRDCPACKAIANLKAGLKEAQNELEALKAEVDAMKDTILL